MGTWGSVNLTFKEVEREEVVPKQRAIPGGKVTPLLPSTQTQILGGLWAFKSKGKALNLSKENTEKTFIAGKGREKTEKMANLTH